MSLVTSKARSASVAIQLLPTSLIPVNCNLDVTTDVSINQCENSPQAQLLHEIGSLRPQITSCRDETVHQYRQAAISLNTAMHRAPPTLPHLALRTTVCMVPMEVLLQSSSLVLSSCLQTTSFLAQICEPQIKTLYMFFSLKSNRSVLNSDYL